MNCRLVVDGWGSLVFGTRGYRIEESFARRMRSRLARTQLSSAEIGDLDHPIELTRGALCGREDAQRRGAIGAANVVRNLTLVHVSERLANVLVAGTAE